MLTKEQYINKLNPSECARNTDYLEVDDLFMNRTFVVSKTSISGSKSVLKDLRAYILQELLEHREEIVDLMSPTTFTKLYYDIVDYIYAFFENISSEQLRIFVYLSGVIHKKEYTNSFKLYAITNFFMKGYPEFFCEFLENEIYIPKEVLNIND